MHFLALAVDYDGTIAENGNVPEHVCTALASLKASGRKLLLITGRELQALKHHFTQLDLFDLVVVENGALLYDPRTDTEELIADSASTELVERLRDKGVSSLSVGRSVIATWHPFEDAVISSIRELGLEDRVTLLLEDYRDLEGQFDKLVSIEMIEAVGHRYLSTYFKQCARLLKPDGLMLLQSITIREQRYAQARRSVDFIQRYIFPGGALPSVSKMLEIVSRDTDMTLHHMEDFGQHYARTLRHWHDNLSTARHKLEDLGYDEYFYRLWEFYLCYCEGGFIERSIGTAQLLLTKPAAHGTPLLGRFDA